LDEEKPDILFIHGVQFLSIRKVIAYLNKHPEIQVFVDGHEDFNNTAYKFISKYILHGLIWRHYARKIEPFVTTFWGVLPARVDFFSQMYGLPKEKTELLVMGTDDEVVKKIDSHANKTAMSEKYNLAHDDFIIVTGGKIDSRKPQTLLLMEAVNNLKNPNVKLIVFGSISDENKLSFNTLLSDSIIYAGWLKSEDIFRLFDIADLAVFPGLHSVLWEQAVGQGVPCIFKNVPGFNHVDQGGNCKYLYTDSVSEIQEVLSSLINNPNHLLDMKKIADRVKEKFYYSSIAKKSCGLTK
jgi:glycosyltransferase involved in cell wall biosynthesis